MNETITSDEIVTVRRYNDQYKRVAILVYLRNGECVQTHEGCSRYDEISKAVDEFIELHRL